MARVTRKPRPHREQGEQVPPKAEPTRSRPATAGPSAPGATQQDAAPAPTTDATPREPSSGVTIVGVGMSAGGFEACTELLKSLPPRPGFALVIVQHLAPNYSSALPALLNTRSPVPVVEVGDGMTLEADRAFVIPPNALIELEDGHVRVLQRIPEGG